MRIKLTALLLLAASTQVWAEKSAPIQGTLENGLQYTILPLHDEKGHIEIRLRVNAGSVDEQDDQAGVAHMIEHLVFRGTKAHPNGLMPYLHEQKWVKDKNYHALTTTDSTTYMLTPPTTAGLEQSFDALSQIVFHANLTQEDLDSERKMMLEEWRKGFGVGTTINEQRTAAVRADSRYARNSVMGTENSINTMPATQLQQFYQSWYAPNNMRLLVVGDVEPEKAKADIQRYFGAQPTKTLPVRDYLEPRLSERLLITKLQDPRSGVSQIAYIFRFDESKSHAQTEEGRYERLLDRFALTALTQRLRNQSSQLPKGVSTLVVRKSDIGQQTAALGIFANVDPTAHLKGLSQISEEIARIKQYPITAEELERYKKTFLSQIEHAKKHTGDRDFAKWVKAMDETVLKDKPFLTQPELATRMEALLPKITPEAVNARIQSWLSATDRLVNYQPPLETKLTLTEAEINQAIADGQTREIAAPQPAKDILPMSLENVEGKGSITEEQAFDAEQVKHWRLSNGDKVVWLKSPLAKETTFFAAESSAGFKAEGLNPWQSQLASQLVEKNAPLDWEAEQLDQWKSEHKVNFSIKQDANKLLLSGNVENSELPNLLRLFYAYTLETKVKEGLDDGKKGILSALKTREEKADEAAQVKSLIELRYGSGSTDDSLPTKAELEQLTATALDEQWTKMMRAPTTYYLMNNMEEAQVKALVTQYLADFPRSKRLNSTQGLPTEGNAKTVLTINGASKDDIRIWSFTSHQWQAKDAVLVSLLRNIATEKLKTALKEEQLSVYSLRFESTLNPQTDRIESELAFTANPEMTEKLIARAKTVFDELPNQITEEDVQQAKAAFIKAEKERLNAPETWLSRLILSENKLSTPAYLSEMKQLADGITREKMQAMASQIFSSENEKIFITTPKKSN